MALSDQLAAAHEDISTEKVPSWLYRSSSLETTRIIEVTTDYAEDVENPSCTENRSPPYGLASSRAEGQLRFPSLDMICLFLGVEVCLAALLILSKAGTSLSDAANTLLFVAKILGFTGFLSCLGACIVQRSHRASRLMSAMGCAASFCGFLSILGTLFTVNLMLWLIGALCVLPISPYLFLHLSDLFEWMSFPPHDG